MILDSLLDLRSKVWRYRCTVQQLTTIMGNIDRLHTEKIIADRKTFYLDLLENARGKVVKITEEVSGNRDTIMIPAEILGDFIDALGDIKATADE